MAPIFWPLPRYSLPMCTLYELGEGSDIHRVTVSERVGQGPRERKIEILGGGGGRRQRPREWGRQRRGAVEQSPRERGRDPGRGTETGGGGQGPRGRAGSAQSTPAHIPHHAVGSSEYPPRVAQHAATVELVAVEQGHLPGLGAS